MIAGLEQRGLSRSEIARGSGVSKATVTRYGNGTIVDPSYLTAIKIQKFADSVRVFPLKQKRA